MHISLTKIIESFAQETESVYSNIFDIALAWLHQHKDRASIERLKKTALHNENPLVRLRCAIAVSDLDPSQALSVIQEVMKLPGMELHCEDLLPYLSDLSGPEVTKYLLEAAAEYGSVAAIINLGSREGDDVDQILIAFAGCDVEELRAAAAQALTFHEGHACSKTLLKLISDGLPSVREAALDASAFRHIPQFLEAILNRLEDEFEEVRIAAILACQGREDERVRSDLLQLLKTEKNLNVLMHLVQVVDKLKGDDITSLFFDLLNHQGDPDDDEVDSQNLKAIIDQLLQRRAGRNFH